MLSLASQAKRRYGFIAPKSWKFQFRSFTALDDDMMTDISCHSEPLAASLIQNETSVKTLQTFTLQLIKTLLIVYTILDSFKPQFLYKNY